MGNLIDPIKVTMDFYNSEIKTIRAKQYDKKSRYIDTLNMLLDMDILIHSSFFIGTYTSNVSRIVPLYVGFEKSLSLDDEWKL